MPPGPLAGLNLFKKPNRDHEIEQAIRAIEKYFDYFEFDGKTGRFIGIPRKDKQSELPPEIRESLEKLDQQKIQQLYQQNRAYLADRGLSVEGEYG